jgi:hypothetical protein
MIKLHELAAQTAPMVYTGVLTCWFGMTHSLQTQDEFSAPGK